MKFARLFIIITILAIIPLSLMAGTTGKIAGIVTDRETGEPLPGVNVVVKGTLLGASTDLDGAFFIINVPVGTYEVEVSYVGYQTITVKNVRVQADLTSRQDLELTPSVMELGEEIVVIAEKPIIQNDLTASRTTMSSQEIQAIPFENVEGIVNITPGFVDGHARGGRDGEVSYQIDGVTIMDPMTRGFDSNVPEFAVEEISVITGGFSTEYGDAQSGVVNMVIREGGPQYSGSIRYKTSDLSKVSEKLVDNHALHNMEFSLGGPDPITSLFGYKDKLRFFVAGEYERDYGRFENQYDRNFNLSTKFSWTPNQYHKVTLSYGGNWGEYGVWSQQWSRTTYEDQNPLLKKSDENDPLYGWYGNGQLDSEDLNGNGMLDPGEDLNGNGILETEDLNRDGKMNKYSMLDALPQYDELSNHFILNWTYQISSKSFFEAKLSQSFTSLKYNVHENINEDSDGDGHLDLAWDVDGDGEVDDIDGDGDYRHEDLNGNNKWDWSLDNGDTDLFVDENDNGYIDASEGRPKDEWLLWEEAPFGNAQDNDGFYTYGNGLTYYRLRWNYDEKTTWKLKLAYYNQIDNNNEIKTGIEGAIYDIIDHDIDLASGGNVYGQNITAEPYSFAAFIEDKMEYEGMILNFGLRFDYFNANSTTPANPEEPFELEGGQLGYKDQVNTKARTYVSPRLGISHPITNRDVIYFNYGRYFQMPQFSRLYTNSSFQLVGAFPIIGNPDMDPETTTSYELGVKHAFSDDMKLELKGFYKDIRGLTDMTTHFYNAANWAGFYTNLDYGNTRGFELQLYKRYSRYWSGTFNYTYSIAKGKSSSPTQNYSYAWSGDVVPTEENFLDWDQRHTINANLNFRVPYDENLFGTTAFNDIGLNMVFKYGSGLPYSSEARTKIPPINDQRMPATYDLDMIFDKTFTLGSKYKFKFFIWGNNLLDDLFDHVNIVDIKEVSYYDQDQDGDGKPDRDPTGRYNDPSAYSEGSTYRVGVQFDF